MNNLANLGFYFDWKSSFILYNVTENLLNTQIRICSSLMFERMRTPDKSFQHNFDL